MQALVELRHATAREVDDDEAERGADGDHAPSKNVNWANGRLVGGGAVISRDCLGGDCAGVFRCDGPR